MAYQVIARKYRPQRFADVIGQEHVTQTLANAIEQKRISTSPPERRIYPAATRAGCTPAG